MISEQHLRRIAASSAILSLLIGLMIGLEEQWPPWFYVDLIGPLFMFGFCMIVMQKQRLVYGLVLDLLVGWPLVTALIAGG